MKKCMVVLFLFAMTAPHTTALSMTKKTAVDCTCPSDMIPSPADINEAMTTMQKCSVDDLIALGKGTLAGAHAAKIGPFGNEVRGLATYGDANGLYQPGNDFGDWNYPSGWTDAKCTTRYNGLWDALVSAGAVGLCPAPPCTDAAFCNGHGTASGTQGYRTCTCSACAPGYSGDRCQITPRDTGHGRGDPHLVNVKGEAFDVMQTGNMLLLETPRGGTTETLNLAVRADIDRLGVVACAPTYITNVYMTGHWLGAPVEINSGRIVKTGGSHGFGIRLDKQWQSHADFWTTHNGGMKLSNDTTVKTATRKFIMKVGVLDIVVKQPDRPRIFLDIQIKGISKINAEVGGLLGVDDHAKVEELPSECKATSSLLELN